jgi:nucleoside-diphosphate-sugar epimerase
MLVHRCSKPAPPARVVVIGARGFIGGAIARHLAQEGRHNLALGRAQLDLLDANAGDKLAAMLRPSDAMVMVSAQAPCKTPTMMLDNVRMAAVVCEAIASRPVDHVVYVSSDAVYADAPLPLSESAPAAPTTLHGAMHLAREQMLASVVGDTPFAILRPTLVYGAADPHNGYGPNRFRRFANSGEPIVLFGEGEERRDHVDVADIAAVTRLVLDHRSHGILNIATGAVTSFRDVADQVVALSPNKVPIKGSPRVGPMPHNGYRPFDPAATFAAFPGFRYTPLAEGLARAQRKEFA